MMMGSPSLMMAKKKNSPASAAKAGMRGGDSAGSSDFAFFRV